MRLKSVLILVSLFAFVNSFAQTAATDVKVSAKPVAVTHHVVAPVTPPIKNIAAAPKEVNRKKRKTSPVTVARHTSTAPVNAK